MNEDRSKIASNLENILNEINEKIEIANEGLLKVKVAEEFISKKRREMNLLFPKDSKIQLRYEKLSEDKFLKWWKVDKKIFVNEHSSNYQQLLTLQDIVKELLKDCDPEFLIEHISKQDNFYFPKGDIYNARRMLIKILKSAKNDIVIIDPYLDDTIFDFIELIDSEISFKLLTSSKTKKVIIKLFNDLKTTRTTIQVKQSDDFHDRYIIINEKVIWHLGASINYMGRKAFQINKVITESEINKIINDYNSWWQNGNIIV